jgi:hypothetical protein
MGKPYSLKHVPVERRASQRERVMLPASVAIGAQAYSARMVNIERSGAMLETAAPVLAGASVVVHCGTVAAQAVVVWTGVGRIGVHFVSPLRLDEVEEQLSRARALVARRGV